MDTLQELVVRKIDSLPEKDDPTQVLTNEKKLLFKLMQIYKKLFNMPLKEQNALIGQFDESQEKKCKKVIKELDLAYKAGKLIIKANEEKTLSAQLDDFEQFLNE